MAKVPRPPKHGSPELAGCCGRHHMLCDCQADRLLRATLTVEDAPDTGQPPRVTPTATRANSLEPVSKIQPDQLALGNASSPLDELAQAILDQYKAALDVDYR